MITLNIKLPTHSTEHLSWIPVTDSKTNRIVEDYYSTRFRDSSADIEVSESEYALYFISPYHKPELIEVDNMTEYGVFRSHIILQISTCFGVIVKIDNFRIPVIVPHRFEDIFDIASKTLIDAVEKYCGGL